VSRCWLGRLAVADGDQEYREPRRTPEGFRRHRGVVDRPRERRCDTADVSWRVGLAVFTVACWLAAFFYVWDHVDLHVWRSYVLLGLSKVGWLLMAYGAYRSVKSWDKSRWGKGI
jgi:hypothetical protein